MEAKNAPFANLNSLTLLNDKYVTLPFSEVTTPPPYIVEAMSPTLCPWIL